MSNNILNSMLRYGLVMLLLAGCAAQKLQREGLALIEQGRYEQGLQKLEKATKESPNDVTLKMDLYNGRERAVNKIFAAIENAKASGNERGAESGYRRILGIAPNNPKALEGLRQLEKRDLHAEAVEQAQLALKNGDIDQAESLVQQVLAVNAKHTAAMELNALVQRARMKESLATPQIQSRLKKLTSLEFRDGGIKMVFDVLARASGINFIFDKDVRSDIRVTIFVRNVAVEDAIDFILAQSQLEKKILSDNSVLIYPDTPAKIKQHQDLIVRTFYIVNSSAKDTAETIKNILKTKDLHVDEARNLIVVRDTPEAIRLIEKVIRTQDLAEPEVVLEMEVLEINRNRALELGVSWPDTFTWLVPNPARITLADLPSGGDLTSTNIGVNASTALKLRQDNSIVNVISNPRIRVKNRDKAKVLVGDRVPVITSSVVPGSTNPVTTENITYLDVGLKLDVEPLILLDDNVSIKVALEVSTLGESVVTKQGSVAFRVGTRSINTSLQLKDGETQVLMGLIRDEERNTASGLPGLMDIPILGRLFSQPKDSTQKTEIVLSITPRIVRKVKRPDAHDMELWSGTETNLKVRRASLQNNAVEKSTVVAHTMEPPKPAEAQPFQINLSAPTEAKVGEQFTLEVNGSATTPLLGAVVALQFDPAILEMVNVLPGEFFKQPDSEIRITHKLSDENGKLEVDITNTGIEGAQGKGGLFSVTFKVKVAAEKTQIQLSTVTPWGLDDKTMTYNLGSPLSISLKP